MPQEYDKPSAVIAVIFNKERSSVLLTKRRDVPVWVLPGGGVEEGEEPEAAVLREIAEETSCCVDIIRKAAEYSPCNRLACLTHVFEVVYVDGEPKESPETADCSFFPIEDLPKMFFPIHHRWFNEVLRNDPTMIRRPLLEVSYPALFFAFFRHPILISRALLARMGFPINS